VYATRVDAGITGLQLANGGERSIASGDAAHDSLRIEWTNQGAFDSLLLRVFRIDGTFVGSQSLGGIATGGHVYNWDGHIGGVLLPTGAYVVQLQGLRGSTAYIAPSASPVSDEQIARFGVNVGPAVPTSVLSFERPVSPNRASTLTWSLTFGGSIAGLRATDFARSGTATGCVIGTPAGAGAHWTVTLTGCSAGTVTLGLRANAVVDAVRNWGPDSQVNAAQLLIDRSKPVAAAPKISLRANVDLASTSPTALLPATLTWSATDPGGAGIRAYELRRSVDGAAFAAYAADVTGTSMSIGLTPGHAYRFEVRATDRAGNVGGWVAGPTFHAYLTQQTNTSIGWAGAWTSVSDDRFSGGSARFATAAGAKATYSFTGRAIAWVTTFAPNRGVAKVYLDGVLVATIDTASTTAFHRVAFAKTWSSSGFHTLRIVVVGTVGRPRVDVDGLEVLR